MKGYPERPSTGATSANLPDFHNWDYDEATFGAAYPKACQSAVIFLETSIP